MTSGSSLSSAFAMPPASGDRRSGANATAGSGGVSGEKLLSTLGPLLTMADLVAG